MRRLTSAYFVASLFVLACGDDDTGTTTTTSSASSTSAAGATTTSASTSTGGTDGGGGEGGSPPKFDLTFEGTGYADFEGAGVQAVVLRGGVVVETGEATVSAGGFTITWPSVLEDGATYRVAFFADGNEDGYCLAPAPDGVWQVDVPSSASDQTVVAPWEAVTEAELCALFDVPPAGTTLTVDGTEFEAEEGKTVLGVARIDTTVMKEAQDVVAAGSFSLVFDELAVGDYAVDFYADMDGDAACTAADHAWTIPGPIPIREGVPAGFFMLGTAPTSPCGSFE